VLELITNRPSLITMPVPESTSVLFSTFAVIALAEIDDRRQIAVAKIAAWRAIA
jgi:putative Ca2+/H+ antiporter (TMEM165/GDT1 family)